MAGNEIVNTLPDANVATFRTQSRAFWQTELPAILSRMDLESGICHSGGLHATAAGLTSAAFAVEAFSNQGNRHTCDSNGGTVALTYPSITGVCWVVSSPANVASLPSSSFTRSGSTNIYIDSTTGALRPALPANATWLMRVTIGGGAITLVQDLRVPMSYAQMRMFDVTDNLYGAIPNGAGDQYAALAACFAAYGPVGANPAGVPAIVANPPGIDIVGKKVKIPRGWYRCASTLIVPVNTIIEGEGMDASRILQTASVDQINLSRNAQIRDLGLVGGGSLGFTGRGVLINDLTGGGAGSNGGFQIIDHCRIEEHLAYCIETVGVFAGALLEVNHCNVGRYDGGTINKECIKLADSDASSGIRHVFNYVNCYGYCGIHLGESHMTVIHGCRMGSLIYTDNCGASMLTATRLIGSPGGGYHIKGLEHIIHGCEIEGQVTLDPGASYCHIGLNAYANGFATMPNDNSGNQTNYLVQIKTAQPVVWQADTVNPAIGNGSAYMEWSRNGYIVTVNIFVAMGTTTTYGTGPWYFVMPYEPATVANVLPIGTLAILQSGVKFRSGFVRLTATHPSKAYMYVDNAVGAVGTGAPHAWANGDTLTITITYNMAHVP